MKAVCNHDLRCKMVQAEEASHGQDQFQYTDNCREYVVSSLVVMLFETITECIIV